MDGNNLLFTPLTLNSFPVTPKQEVFPCSDKRRSYAVQFYSHLTLFMMRNEQLAAVKAGSSNIFGKFSNYFEHFVLIKTFSISNL